jgi:DNA ligase-1
MFKPHLAIDAGDKIPFPCIVQPKIDGVRGLYLPGQRGFTGRSLKPFANRHLTNLYSHPALVGFDGELIVGSNQVSPDLCRTTTSLVNSIAPCLDTTWWLFDWITSETYYRGYNVRRTMLQDWLEKLESHAPHITPRLRLVPQERVRNRADLDLCLQAYLDQGYEGLIIRDPDAAHKSGRATQKEAAFMRIKDFATEEATIIGMTEAEENQNEQTTNELGLSTRSSHKAGKAPKGMIGALTCSNAKWGIFTIGPGKLTLQEREYYFNNPQEILGGCATYKYLKTGCKDKPRMATFQHFRASQDLITTGD